MHSAENPGFCACHPPIPPLPHRPRVPKNDARVSFFGAAGGENRGGPRSMGGVWPLEGENDWLPCRPSMEQRPTQTVGTRWITTSCRKGRDQHRRHSTSARFSTEALRRAIQPRRNGGPNPGNLLTVGGLAGLAGSCELNKRFTPDTPAPLSRPPPSPHSGTRAARRAMASSADGSLLSCTTRPCPESQQPPPVPSGSGTPDLEAVG